jgi:uncharacterized protein YebE (UPF0316 family)
MDALLAGLFVFVMRVTDMTLDTLRLLFTMRGRKLLAGAIGVIQATEFTAHGRNGMVPVVNGIVARKNIPAVRAIIEQTDPQAFITLEAVQPLRRGYFRH